MTQDEIIARASITEKINQLFIYTDDRSWDLLCAEVLSSEVDYSTLGSRQRLSSRELCKRWSEGFADLDDVYHHGGNYIINIKGNSASATATAITIHFRRAAKKGNTRTFAGTYTFHFIETEVGWRIDTLSYKLRFMDGNQALT